jgi:hypothetical protein
VRSLALLVVLALAAIGCRATTRYYLPARGDAGREQLALCRAQCDESAGRGAYLSCLERCPGLRVEQGKSCTDRDVRPGGLCEQQRGFDRSRTLGGLGIAAAAALLLLVALVVAPFGAGG